MHHHHHHHHRQANLTSSPSHVQLRGRMWVSTPVWPTCEPPRARPHGNVRPAPRPPQPGTSRPISQCATRVSITLVPDTPENTAAAPLPVTQHTTLTSPSHSPDFGRVTYGGAVLSVTGLRHTPVSRSASVGRHCHTPTHTHTRTHTRTHTTLGSHPSQLITPPLIMMFCKTFPCRVTTGDSHVGDEGSRFDRTPDAGKRPHHHQSATAPRRRGPLSTGLRTAPVQHQKSCGSQAAVRGTRVTPQWPGSPE